MRIIVTVAEKKRNLRPMQIYTCERCGYSMRAPSMMRPALLFTAGLILLALASIFAGMALTGQLNPPPANHVGSGASLG
jgi:hypothetical protein